MQVDNRLIDIFGQAAVVSGDDKRRHQVAPRRSDQSGGEFIEDALLPFGQINERADMLDAL